MISYFQIWVSITQPPTPTLARAMDRPTPLSHAPASNSLRKTVLQGCQNRELAALCTPPSPLNFFGRGFPQLLPLLVLSVQSQWQQEPFPQPWWVIKAHPPISYEQLNVGLGSGEKLMFCADLRVVLQFLGSRGSLSWNIVKGQRLPEAKMAAGNGSQREGCCVRNKTAALPLDDLWKKPDWRAFKGLSLWRC